MRLNQYHDLFFVVKNYKGDQTICFMSFYIGELLIVIKINIDSEIKIF